MRSDNLNLARGSYDAVMQVSNRASERLGVRLREAYSWKFVAVVA